MSGKTFILMIFECEGEANNNKLKQLQYNTHEKQKIIKTKAPNLNSNRKASSNMKMIEHLRSYCTRCEEFSNWIENQTQHMVCDWIRTDVHIRMKLVHTCLHGGYIPRSDFACEILISYIKNSSLSHPLRNYLFNIMCVGLKAVLCCCTLFTNGNNVFMTAFNQRFVYQQ